jgi:hypothetical protein
VPVLIFEKSHLIITHNKKPIYITWSEIINWQIEREDHLGSPYLVIKNNKSKVKLNIGGLKRYRIKLMKIYLKQGKY